jgi:tetratricopeptide (TPR) repeat protein
MIPIDDVNNVGRHSLWRRLLGFVFGYDFFVSYSWSDGGSYASALTRQLRAQGFEVFFDRDDYASGDDWKKVGAWKLRRTGQLVLVGSPAAVLSVPVIREIQIFNGTGRRIVPIDFDGSLEWKTNDVPLAQYLPAQILRIKEPIAALKTGPSDQVVATIRRTFNLVRQDKKRVRAFAIIALLLGILAAVAVWEAIQATRARDVAQEQRDRAQRVLAQIEAEANGRVTALVERAQEAATAQDEIAKVASPNVGAVPDLARATELIELSGRYFESQDFAGALKAAQTALALLGAASGASQTGSSRLLARSKAYERIGLAEAHLGRIDDAGRDLATSLELIQGLAIEAPQDVDFSEQMASALVNSGDICVETQKFQDAERHFNKATELRSAAAKLPGSSVEARRLLAVAHYRMANLQLAQNRYDEALETSKLSISILEELRAEEPDNPALRRSLSVAYDIRANILDAAGNAELALTWREKDFAIIKPLADSDLGNIVWQHDLATNLDRRGQALEKLGRNDAALEAYTGAIVIGETLKARGRIPSEWLRDTAGSLELRGTLLTRLGRPAEGVLAFRHGLAMLEQLASSSPDVISHRNLEDAYRRAREALLKSNHPIEALETAEQQLFAISLAIDRERDSLDRLARVLSSLCWTALLAQNAQRAELAGRQAVALAPGLLSAKLNHAHALMYTDELAGAKKIYLDGLSAGGEAAVRWRTMIRSDFADLSARNLRHPFMAEIEREIEK